MTQSPPPYFTAIEPNASSNYIDTVFGPSGLLAAQFPGYKPREGQLQLTRMIDRGIREGKHVLAEAPTGTGKSLAYLVPAIYNTAGSDKCSVIATANIALQEQLVEKDLPLLRRTLPLDFTYALIKGRNNYLCLRSLYDTEVRNEHSMFSDEFTEQINQVLKWATTTVNGDVSELPFVPAPNIWSRFSVTSEDCAGKDCKHFENCYARKARAAAEEANIVVTNYHMLFAHLSVRLATSEDIVLPKFDMVICDEAHEIAGIARDFFGIQVSEFTVGNIAREASKVPTLRSHVERLKLESGRFFESLRRVRNSAEYNVRLRKGKPADGTIQYEALTNELIRLRMIAGNESGYMHDERTEKALKYVEKHSAKTAALITEICKLEDDGKIYWIEEDAKQRCKLVGKPLDVAPVLQEELFEQGWPVAMVSATLTTNGNFNFIRKETGVPKDALELVAESPFNFRRQALLVVPEELVEPNSPSFPGIASRLIERVIRMCNGRTLGLFTSYKNMRATHERIQNLPYTVLKQGDAPRTELVRKFKSDVHSVLLGTTSFWTGVDVSGEALTGLVIDRLPFPNPDDPIIDAITERDKNAFSNYMVPQAIIALRQGVGRLIRSIDDVGVVVILDVRVATKGYGKRFLNSLPDMRSTRDVDAIETFLAEANEL